ncbi:MAG: VWA domain-containing protein [Acidobacteria bacterium]|nr:VWA domain-containing protein [Acidobacteriota bacterium]
MNMRLSRAVLAPIAAAAVWVAAAQQDGPDRIDRTIRQTVNVVVAPTTVLDKDGGYVTGLKPSDFKLYDNDKLQDIRVSEIAAPISLVVVIQANAKVESILPKIRKLGTVLQAMVAGDLGQVALVAFDHRIRVLQDFTNDATKLQEALQKLTAGSSTARVVDAVNEATRMLRNRPKEHRRVILLISESLDRGSEGHTRETLTNTEINNVTVYALNISRIVTELTSKAPPPRPDPVPPGGRPTLIPGMPNTPTTQTQITGRQGQSADFVPVITEIFRGVKAIFVPNPVEVFTRYTGGKEIPFVTQRDLERAVAEVGREIHNQYLIAYSPNNTEDGGFHKIQVEVARRNLEVRTRPGYWMAAYLR